MNLKNFKKLYANKNWFNNYKAIIYEKSPLMHDSIPILEEIGALPVIVESENYCFTCYFVWKNLLFTHIPWDKFMPYPTNIFKLKNVSNGEVQNPYTITDNPLKQIFRPRKKQVIEYLDAYIKIYDKMKSLSNARQIEKKEYFEENILPFYHVKAQVYERITDKYKNFKTFQIKTHFFDLDFKETETGYTAKVELSYRIDKVKFAIRCLNVFGHVYQRS